MAGIQFAAQYTRLNRKPIDDSTVFESLNNLDTYAAVGAAYAGQIVAVKVSAGVMDLYKFVTDTTYEKFENPVVELGTLPGTPNFNQFLSDKNLLKSYFQKNQFVLSVKISGGETATVIVGMDGTLGYTVVIGCFQIAAGQTLIGDNSVKILYRKTGEFWAGSWTNWSEIGTGTGTDGIRVINLNLEFPTNIENLNFWLDDHNTHKHLLEEGQTAVSLIYGDSCGVMFLTGGNNYALPLSQHLLMNAQLIDDGNGVMIVEIDNSLPTRLLKRSGILNAPPFSGSWSNWEIVSLNGGSGGATDYSSLSNLPKLNTNNTLPLAVPPSAETILGTVQLHKVSKTGSYNDLNEKPTNHVLSSRKINGHTLAADIDLTADDINMLSSPSTVEDAIVDIQSLIPAQATTSNMLADKDFVNSSINSSAAFFFSYNAQGDNFPSKAALTSAVTFYRNGVANTPSRNDYVVVTSDETNNNAQTKYINVSDTSTPTWQLMYVINDAPFTSNQQKAIDSGITAELVQEFDEHVNDADVHVTAQDKQKWNSLPDGTRLKSGLINWSIDIVSGGVAYTNFSGNGNYLLCENSTDNEVRAPLTAPSDSPTARAFNTIYRAGTGKVKLIGNFNHMDGTLLEVAKNGLVGLVHAGNNVWNVNGDLEFEEE